MSRTEYEIGYKTGFQAGMKRASQIAEADKTIVNGWHVGGLIAFLILSEEESERAAPLGSEGTTT